MIFPYCQSRYFLMAFGLLGFCFILTLLSNYQAGQAPKILKWSPNQQVNFDSALG
jgi:hypothetical protein